MNYKVTVKHHKIINIDIDSNKLQNIHLSHELTNNCIFEGNLLYHFDIKHLIPLNIDVNHNDIIKIKLNNEPSLNIDIQIQKLED